MEKKYIISYEMYEQINDCLKGMKSLQAHDYNSVVSKQTGYAHDSFDNLEDALSKLEEMKYDIGIGFGISLHECTINDDNEITLGNLVKSYNYSNTFDLREYEFHIFYSANGNRNDIMNHNFKKEDANRYVFDIKDVNVNIIMQDDDEYFVFVKRDKNGNGEIVKII